MTTPAFNHIDEPNIIQDFTYQYYKNKLKEIGIRNFFTIFYSENSGQDKLIQDQFIEHFEKKNGKSYISNYKNYEKDIHMITPYIKKKIVKYLAEEYYKDKLNEMGFKSFVEKYYGTDHGWESTVDKISVMEENSKSYL